MPSFAFFSLLCLLAVFGANTASGESLLHKGINGGTKCAACVLLVGLTDQLAEIHNETISDSFARLCSYLPLEFQVPCKWLVEEFGPGVIEVLENRYTADIACHSIGFCTRDGPELCHLFPLPPGDSTLAVQRATRFALGKRGRPFSLPPICEHDLFRPICDLIDKFANGHEPLDDEDGDGFSVLHTFRGADWRGKDCNDLDKEVYPGHHTVDDAKADTNCNGIVGRDPLTNRTYEEQWCKGTQPLGTIVLGDSAGAHFHIPPQWMTASQLNKDTYSDLLLILENEFDWPMLSLMTGFDTTQRWKNSIQGPMDSIYLKMRERNRCNHRDFQNIAVNGAKSSSIKQIAESMSRISGDNPALVMVELIGNDVCSGHNDTNHMTKVEDYYNKMSELLSYLNDRLSRGSVVMASGLADGRLLYDILHDRVHPIGSTRKDVTYSQLYDFLNCLQISPCFGWMNSNETIRNLTTEHGEKLNKALKDLISSSKFDNIAVYDFPLRLNEIVDSWEHDPADLIEPVDGFHPSQTANALMANRTWERLLHDYPGILPPVNPHNELITKKFGDQGGY